MTQHPRLRKRGDHVWSPQRRGRLNGSEGATLVVVVLAAVFSWSTLAGGLRRSPVTAAVVVVVLGVVLVLVQVISRLRWVTS